MKLNQWESRVITFVCSFFHITFINTQSTMAETSKKTNQVCFQYPMLLPIEIIMFGLCIKHVIEMFTNLMYKAVEIALILFFMKVSPIVFQVFQINLEEKKLINEKREMKPYQIGRMIVTTLSQGFLDPCRWF